MPTSREITGRTVRKKQYHKIRLLDHVVSLIPKPLVGGIEPTIEAARNKSVAIAMEAMGNVANTKELPLGLSIESYCDKSGNVEVMVSATNATADRFLRKFEHLIKNPFKKNASVLE